MEDDLKKQKHGRQSQQQKNGRRPQKKEDELKHNLKKSTLMPVT